MAASMTNPSLPFLISPEKRSVSDNERLADIAETRINAGHSLFSASLQQVFCELAKLPVTCARLLSAFAGRIMCALLGDRDVYEFYASVKAYLLWRRSSSLRRGLSFRNQSSEVGALTHALNILNSLEASGLASADPERNQLYSELGRELELAKAQYRASLPPKKSPEKVRVKKAGAA